MPRKPRTVPPPPKVIPAAAAELLAEIRQNFGKVQRTEGISLHETAVIDNYGSADERRKARALDTDRYWWEVKDEWIDENSGVGGLAFLDGPAHHYYLPAYMSYWLRNGNEPFGFSFHLERARLASWESRMTPEQQATIATFKAYVARHDVLPRRRW